MPEVARLFGGFGQLLKIGPRKIPHLDPGHNPFRQIPQPSRQGIVALGCLLDVPHIFQCIQKTMARAFLDAEGRRHIGDRHVAALHDVLEYLQPPLKGQDAGRV